ncbi:hypothetical protein QM467_08775 [Rhodoblastus sp. 17X3]|uniref:hypothetical protein n=1 Tax=Rhodoblastus sp. 17X3 TaxID=3047026 RepID=UPI0024B77885|nr:hypothetical protein [Rhodoblastus sp. 17X3]MDI9848142.1 hypothetical protein [Rhodoblastus sp. 17X3]
MNEVCAFPDRRDARPAQRRPSGAGGRVLQFPERLPIAYAAYVVREGRKRRSWVCVIHRAGEDPYELPARTEKDARYIAGLMLKGFAEDRALERDPVAHWIKMAFAMPEEIRHAIGRRFLGIREE